MISVTFDWADGTYTFRLGLAQLQELQEKCDAGPEFIRARIASGFPNALDLRETIRLGLVGGGTKPETAIRLVRRYVDDAPRLNSHGPALAILQACLAGVPDDPVGKSAAGEETATTAPASPTESGPSPES